jgi:hypothetical protein
MGRFEVLVACLGTVLICCLAIFWAMLAISSCR